MSRSDISSAALKVLYRLHRYGYLAYLVGGSVRDLLLGLRPKDFDVCTNARPQEIRRLFRNSRIIGRRFRLVHVLFRGEVVEVATFRADPEPPEAPEDWAGDEVQDDVEEAAAEGGDPASIARDEPVYGTPAEDARRRDFTVNALFYNIADFSVLDYVGGLADLERRTLRTIGEPDDRFETDPVRMMRALEYAVRLGFDLDHDTEGALERCRDLIAESSPARLTYELLEGLRSGSAAGILPAWDRYGIYRRAFPELGETNGTLRAILSEVDRRHREGGSFPDASLLGALFLPTFRGLLDAATGDGGKVDNVALLGSLRDTLEAPAARMHVANHTLHLMRQGLFTLSKLQRPPERGRQVLKLVRQDYFDVAWDLLELAAAAGLLSASPRKAWAAALRRVRAGASADEIVEGDGAGGRRRPRRRRRSRRRRKS